ncbi:hypothetical protein [Rhodococcus sp. RCBS9]|uniref:hypothetical protein n=1 Tax=Rhodococcus sp. RCBS9 TaxID=3031999 RepID=UPI00240271CC|nr:hypothetical protein [Rhodococcus sp. RCBS9]WEX02781.1 hypothetical protein P0M12_24495 [Rhodococcus sp. RCBS9]
MSNTPTESEFDKELSRLLNDFALEIYKFKLYEPSAEWDGKKKSAREAIKLAVDKNVIGENLRTESLTTSGLINARMAQNRLKDHQRRNLYGGDKK